MERNNDISPLQYDVSRRRFLRNAAATAVGVPAFTALLNALGGEGTANASITRAGTTNSSTGQAQDPYPSHRKYHFTMVCHVLDGPFFVGVRYGAQDACTLLNCSYSWVGSTNSIISQEVEAMNSAIDSKTDGIAVPVISATGFNAVTERALGAGIPVIAYNASPPPGSTNAALAYVGQELTTVGTQSAKIILDKGYAKKGDLVAGFIATPGAANLQPRIDGCKTVLEAAGIKFEQVETGADPDGQITAAEAWYLGHKDVKFMYTVDGNDAGSTVQKYNLTAKGIHCNAFDLENPIPQLVNEGDVAFTWDQQPYLQGFLPILQLFLYQVSGGLVAPVDTDTGLKLVTKSNIQAYTETDRYEGNSTTPKLLTPPKVVPVTTA